MQSRIRLIRSYILVIAVIFYTLAPASFGAQKSAAEKDKNTIATEKYFEDAKRQKTKRNVGFSVIDISMTVDGQTKTIPVAVWYPSSAKPEEHIYGGDTKGKVAIDGAVLNKKDEKYPLVVFSHGYGGGGIASVFFTESLARKGWIVAAPDHGDKFNAVRSRTGTQDFDKLGMLKDAKQISSATPQDRDKYAYRMDEIKGTLDGIIASAKFGRFIDRERIAVGGHSFGGFTALSLCGTIPARHDKRIKALLLFSTGAGGYLYTAKELAGVNIPTMLFFGEKERNAKRGGQTMEELSYKIYKNISTTEKYLLVLKNASHFSFNNSFADTLAAKALSGKPEEFRTINHYSIFFLQKYLQDSDWAKNWLKRKISMILEYRQPVEKEKQSDEDEGKKSDKKNNKSTAK